MYTIIALFIYLGISSLLNTQDVTKIEYSELVQMVENNEILSIEIDDSGYIRAKSKDGIFYKTYAPSLLVDQQYVYGLANQGIEIKYVKSFGNSWWVTLLTIFYR